MAYIENIELPFETGARPPKRGRLLDVEGVAEELSTSVRHIRRLVHERRIPVVRVGRLIRFDPADIEVWLDEHRTSAEP
jgi:excisionase family DNA binding protein